MLDSEEMRTCNWCGEDKPRTDFYDKNRNKNSRPEWVDPVCKRCRIKAANSPSNPRLAEKARQKEAQVKICNGCKQEKAWKEYGASKTGRFGLQGRCKSCLSADQKARYVPKNNPPSCHQHTCKECEKTYESSHKRSTFCSGKCRQRFRYHQDPAKEKSRVRAWEQSNIEHHRVQQNHRTNKRRKSVVGSYSTRDWKRLCEQHGQRCAYCGTKPDLLTVDHIVPISRGGSNWIGNIAPACLGCNLEKQNRTIVEWRLWKEARAKRAVNL